MRAVFSSSALPLIMRLLMTRDPGEARQLVVEAIVLE